MCKYLGSCLPVAWLLYCLLHFTGHFLTAFSLIMTPAISRMIKTVHVIFTFYLGQSGLLSECLHHFWTDYRKVKIIKGKRIPPISHKPESLLNDNCSITTLFEALVLLVCSVLILDDRSCLTTPLETLLSIITSELTLNQDCCLSHLLVIRILKEKKQIMNIL